MHRSLVRRIVLALALAVPFGSLALAAPAEARPAHAKHGAKKKHRTSKGHAHHKVAHRAHHKAKDARKNDKQELGFQP